VRDPTGDAGARARHDACSTSAVMSRETGLTEEACAPADMDVVLPEHLCGLWRRVSLETPDAPLDTTTRVFWLQTPTLFADIRIPAIRALSPERTRLDDYCDAELALLAQQDGFAGRTALAADVCQWQREISFQPPIGVPDEGRLVCRGDEIVEDGIHLPYRELWQRVGGSVGSWLARRSITEDPRSGTQTVSYLVAAGEWFLYARSRCGPALEEAPSLLHLGVSRSNCRGGLIALLDFEISLGRRSGGAAPWQITLSTLPFREGCVLSPSERLES